MRSMFNQALKLTKTGGKVLERVRASVQHDIYIEEMRIPVEVGDIFEHSLPSGLQRKMRVTKRKKAAAK